MSGELGQSAGVVSYSPHVASRSFVEPTLCDAGSRLAGDAESDNGHATGNSIGFLIEQLSFMETMPNFLPHYFEQS
jgi:hypothetical protein